MKDIKPFQIVVMVVFGIVALIGLYVFATFTGFGGAQTENVGKVTIWGSLPKNAVEGAIETLAGKDKGYAGVSYVYVRPESFSQDLANALAAGSGPDLILITQEQLAPETPKLELIPFDSIPERTYRDTFAAEFELYLTSGGTYGIPLAIDPLVLYYNRATLSSAGVATPPKSWEAIAGLVGTMTRKEGELVVKSTIPFGSYANVTNARAILSTLFLQAGSSITGRRTEGIRSTLEDSSSLAGTGPVQSALSFYTQFADPVKTVHTWSGSLPPSRQAFLSGDLAFYPGFASELRSLKQGNPNLDFDMAPIPQPSVSSRKSTYGLAYAFAIPKVARNKAGAFQAGMALAGSDIAPLIAERAGMAPARRALLSTPPDDIYSPVFYPEALAAQGWLSPAPATTDGIFAGMIQNVTSGRMSPSEALTSAGQSINAALR